MEKRIWLYGRFLVLFLVINLLIAFYNVCISKPNENKGLNGEKLYKANCAGCHINGQNLIKPNKPIIGSSKLGSKKILREFLEAPPAPMPSFKNITSMDNQFDSLYVYVTSLMGN